MVISWSLSSILLLRHKNQYNAVFRIIFFNLNKSWSHEYKSLNLPPLLVKDFENQEETWLRNNHLQKKRKEGRRRAQTFPWLSM